jgi:hypothetical protein
MVYQRPSRPDELFHHGIKGMKWGIRRYQNYDGSYTQEGVRRYGVAKEKYDTAKSKYKSVKESYKSGESTKAEVKKAKNDLKKSKKSMNAHYDQLSRDKKADKGKELYSQGKTITGNVIQTSVVETLRLFAGVGVANLAGSAVASIGEKYVGSAMASQLGRMTAVGLSAAALAGSGALYIKKSMENENLRAYYGHSRPKL